MANDILTAPAMNAGTTHMAFNVKLADLVGLGDVLSGDITLFTLPANSFITRTVVKTVAPMTGVSTAVGYVKTANHDYGSTSYNLKTAASATQKDLYATEQIETATDVLFHVIVTTEHLDDTTAGEFLITVDYVVRV